MANKQLFEKEWLQLHNSSLFYWDLLQELPAAVLMQKPEAEGWSLLQIMEHLAGAEAAGLQYLQRKQYDTLQNRGFLSAGVRALLLKLALRSTLKFKAPPVLATYPANSSEPGTLLSHWQQTRRQLAEYIDVLPTGKEGALLFKHPVAGPLSIRQMLIFMADHLDHHQRQAKKLLVT